MTTASQSIGRRDAVGLGIETTPGTSVAPQIWLRWLTNALQNKITVIENESAMGVVDRVNDSEIVAKWMEGTVGGKVTSEAIGFLLYGFFSSVSTGSVSSGIYPHTFQMNQSSIPATLTIGRTTNLGGQRHSYGVIDNLEISNEAGGWVEVSTAIKARVGATSSETPAFISTEKEFTSKNITVKVAADIASLTGATAIKASSTKIVLERPSKAFNPLGTDDTPEFDRGEFEARGEFVVRLTDDQYETDFLSNTIHALEVALTNGTTSLKFTAGRVRYRELEQSRDRENVVTATIQWFAEFNTTQNASIVAVLKNTRASYVAA